MTAAATGSFTTDNYEKAHVIVVTTPLIVEEQERNDLVTKHLGLVRRLCGRFRNSGELMEDLVQVGSVGLLKAVAKYDPELGSNFVAYAIPVIVGEIKNYFRDHGWAVKIPRKLQPHKLAVGRSIDRLYQDLGRSPTIQEIAQVTGFSEDEVSQTFEVEFYGKPVSLDTEYDSERSDESSSVIDYLGNVDPYLESAPDRLDLAQALGDLENREKSIIYMYYYQDLSQTEIAKKFALSQVQVSRIQRRALEKLKTSCLGSYHLERITA